MEDAHILGAPIKGGTMFGVFDGHGGSEVARFVAQHLVDEVRDCWLDAPEQELKRLFHRMDELLRDPTYSNELSSLKNGGDSSDRDETSASSNEPRVSQKEALELFQQMLANSEKANSSSLQPLSMNERRRCELPEHPLQAGCTAVVVVHETKAQCLWCANAGDSRAVVSRAGQAVPLSSDHKPDAPNEQARIIAAGGFVECANGFSRVNGNLNLSRSIGDLKYKANAELSPDDQIITAKADVTKYDIEADDDFFIVACDGIWDCVSNQEAVDFVKQRLPFEPLSSICEQLFDHCLTTNPKETRGIGGDNMTCLIVQLKTSR